MKHRWKSFCISINLSTSSDKLADNLGIDKVSRLEWVQSRVDREIEEQKLKLELDERAAEREAEMILQEEFETQKQLDAQAKVPQKLSFLFSIE
ncbi:hypothetical protein PoB_006918300 [Plakobranchus ocellatus]|uniref:Uncharacterized protein n=1 Tax=Plakobranchus ocellatus TaxID=259542 RepID=A0AAV4DEI1_9GAST|nr:hypothetical protein PoB_006918300 [Plakobranchus ocellatus]